MKKLLLLFAFISALAYSQNLCEECVEQNGFYCGDDPVNWTQYSPNGCVPNGPDQFYINDGWEDCVDASDEGDDVVPTTLGDCNTYVEPCDTVYVETLVVEYDTIVEIQYVIDTFYVDIINWFPEYVDCETMLPCSNDIQELLKQSIGDGRMYNLMGQPIVKPKGIYIENGKIYYKIK
jgi:hypothetical protein